MFGKRKKGIKEKQKQRIRGRETEKKRDIKSERGIFWGDIIIERIMVEIIYKINSPVFILYN